MKRLLTMMVLVLTLLSVTVPAQGQIRLGVRGSMALNNLKFRNWGEARDEYNERIGLGIGLNLEVGIPVTGLSVEGGVMYNHRSVEVDNTGAGYYSRDLLTVPVNIKYSLLPNALLNPYLFTGPEFCFLISKKYDRWDNQFRSYSTSWNFGGGVEVLKHVQVSVAYGVGLNHSIKEAFNNSSTRRNIAKGTDRYWTIGVGYVF